MKTYQDTHSMRIVGHAWEVRKKLQLVARTSPQLTLKEWLDQPKSDNATRIPLQLLHLHKRRDRLVAFSPSWKR